MNIIMLRWLWVEIKFIFNRIRKEINNYLKLNFLKYLKNLIIGKNNGQILKTAILNSGLSLCLPDKMSCLDRQKFDANP